MTTLFVTSALATVDLCPTFCDGSCQPGEAGTTDCNGVWEGTDANSLNPDCQGHCLTTDARERSFDCDGQCDPMEFWNWAE